VVIFPHCKVNLGLNVVRKRDDGYHDLETFFFPIPFYDCLEIIQGPGIPGPGVNEIQFSHSGIPIPGEASQNLCVKAYHLLRKDFPGLPGAILHLHKNIPTGAGLGGGSSDGAFTLRLLNTKFRLGISVDKLAEYALALGSDAPFFVQDKPCFAGGRGEELSDVNINFPGYSIMLVYPGIEISTAWAFGRVVPRQPVSHVMNFLGYGNPGMLKDTLVNDFEKPVFEHYPEIRLIKEKLYASGAAYASMSGSGSTVYGFFEGNPPEIDFDPSYFVKSFALK
jgi:4-diphosphocytidyl-2-C-methyl-D-erythritol kinase